MQEPRSLLCSPGVSDGQVDAGARTEMERNGWLEKKCNIVRRCQGWFFKLGMVLLTTEVGNSVLVQAWGKAPSV